MSFSKCPFLVPQSFELSSQSRNFIFKLFDLPQQFINIIPKPFYFKVSFFQSINTLEEHSELVFICSFHCLIQSIKASLRRVHILRLHLLVVWDIAQVTNLGYHFFNYLYNIRLFSLQCVLLSIFKSDQYVIFQLSLSLNFFQRSFCMFLHVQQDNCFGILVFFRQLVETASYRIP